MSVIAGMAMSIQGVMNTRLGENLGAMHANAFVQCTAAGLSLAALFFVRENGFSRLAGTNKLYWLGGVFGLVITVTVMLGIKSLSPTVAISVILVSQLFTASLIDAFGLMDTEKVSFGWTKLAGLALMVCGVLLLKWNRT